MLRVAVSVWSFLMIFGAGVLSFSIIKDMEQAGSMLFVAVPILLAYGGFGTHISWEALGGGAGNLKLAIFVSWLNSALVMGIIALVGFSLSFYRSRFGQDPSGTVMLTFGILMTVYAALGFAWIGRDMVLEGARNGLA